MATLEALNYLLSDKTMDCGLQTNQSFNELKQPRFGWCWAADNDTSHSRTPTHKRADWTCSADSQYE